MNQDWIEVMAWNHLLEWTNLYMMAPVLDLEFTTRVYTTTTKFHDA